MKKLDHNVVNQESSDPFQVNVREEFAVMRLEKLIYDIRDTLVEGSCKLPFFSSFEYAIKALKSQESLLYIAGLLRECLMMVCPSARCDRPIMYDQPDILEKVLSYYSSPEKSKEDKFDVKELDRDLTYYWANLVHSKAANKGTSITLDGYRSYLKKVHALLAYQFESLAMVLREDFIVDNSISISGVSIGKIKRVADYLAREGYIEADSRPNFVSCFTVSPTIPDVPIVWHDWSNRRKEYSIASLYTVFNALGLPMTPSNKKKICQLFYDGEGKAIDYMQLKLRESEKLTHLEEIIKTL